MMKSALILLLANAVGVTAEGVCSRMKFTFNLKPKYVPGNTQSCLSDDYGSEAIEASISTGAIAHMTDLGYVNVSPALVKKGTLCTEYDCSIYPGDDCLPYCVDISFCVGDELAATGVGAISTDHVMAMQQQQIDLLRADLPTCLGIQDQFMLDLHFETV